MMPDAPTSSRGGAEQLPRRDRRTRVDKFVGGDLERRKVQQRANDIEARRRDERRRADLAEPQRRAAEALDQFGVKQQRKSTVAAPSAKVNEQNATSTPISPTLSPFSE